VSDRQEGVEGHEEEIAAKRRKERKKKKSLGPRSALKMEMWVANGEPAACLKTGAIKSIR